MEDSKRDAKLRGCTREPDGIAEEICRREGEAKTRESARKQVLLRLSPSLWNDIAAWAEEDFRSINGQIEYLLSEAVRRRKRS